MHSNFIGSAEGCITISHTSKPGCRKLNNNTVRNSNRMSKKCKNRKSKSSRSCRSMESSNSNSHSNRMRYSNRKDKNIVV